MRRVRSIVLPLAVVATCGALAGLTVVRGARADEADAGVAQAPRARVVRGIAVASVPGVARDDAFALARAVYASRLRPPMVDEESARVLVGDAPPDGAGPRIRELAELRGGLARDDAASRRLLGAMADALDLEGILVVGLGEPVDAGGAPTRQARLYLAQAGALDAARYEPDVAGTSAWKNTVESLERRFGAAEPARVASPPAAFVPAPAAAAPRAETSHKPFYASPWFWGTLGAAALVGGFFVLASQSTGDDPIRVRMQVPQ